MENCNKSVTSEEDSMPSIYEYVVPEKDRQLQKQFADTNSLISIENGVQGKQNETSIQGLIISSPDIKRTEIQPELHFIDKSDTISYDSNFGSMNFNKEMNKKMNLPILNYNFKTYSLQKENDIEIKSAMLKPEFDNNMEGKLGAEIKSAKLKPQAYSHGQKKQTKFKSNLISQFQGIVEEEINEGNL